MSHASQTQSKNSAISPHKRPFRNYIYALYIIFQFNNDDVTTDLRVALPPEGDALERGGANEVRGGAVGAARAPVGLQRPVLGARAPGYCAPVFPWAQQAETGAVQALAA